MHKDRFLKIEELLNDDDIISSNHVSTRQIQHTIFVF